MPNNQSKNMPNNMPNKQHNQDNTKRTSPGQDQPTRQSSERKDQQPHEDQRNASNRSRDR